MIAQVIVDISTSEIDKIFDYNIPSDLIVNKGDRVIVPFGNKRIEGFCIDIVQSSECKTLKDIYARADEFCCVTNEMLQLMKYMKEEFYIRYVDCLRLFIPPKLRGGKVKELVKTFVELNLPAKDILEKLSKRAVNQINAVNTLANGGQYLSELNKQFGNSAIKSLIDNGFLKTDHHTLNRTPFEKVVGDKVSYNLSQCQNDALKKIFESQQTCTLIHGVTGSGKTVVYMEAIKRVLEQGKSAIMLVPEISLTPQTLRNFRSYFGDQVAMLHSGLSSGERFDEWKRLLDNKARIVVGARSAVFAPCQNVGIIIVDEEHDNSYISESNPRFNTISIANFRANYNNGKLVLGSATPSVESYSKAKSGEYCLVKMEKRISDNGMPPINIINMSQEIFYGNDSIFSRQLAEELKMTLDKGEQAMIFLNRRGHSSFVMCRKCGYVAKCEDCDVSLTYHSVDNLLKCHFCGKRYAMLTHCPSCGSDQIRYGKIGTQRVVEELKKIDSNVTALRMDNETTTTKTAYLDILTAFANRQAQVLVGTQMIAKGHDFDNVTLVGILDADMSLYNSDYRCNERTFQLITQVAGRAGRKDKAGKVLLQTYSPNHFVYNFAKNYDYEGFFEKENNTRQVTCFPPYSVIVRVLISGENEDKVIDCAKAIYKEARAIYDQNKQEFYLMQAMKAPINKLQNKYRYQILMRIKNQNKKQIISKIYQLITKNKFVGVSVFVDINPQNMN